MSITGNDINIAAKELNSFYNDREQRTADATVSADWLEANKNFVKSAFEFRYMYDFDWLGRPIIQLPADVALMQHLIWQVKPDIVIETGVAHGGSVVASASFLSLLDFCEWKESGDVKCLTESKRRVIGIDIDIRPYNRDLIAKHPLGDKITLLQGSSISNEIEESLALEIGDGDTVVVFLDSSHTKSHVFEELNIYSKFVSDGSFLVAFDTVVEDFPVGFFPGRDWGMGNGPLSAVDEFLKVNKSFCRDPVGNKLAMNSASRFGVLVKNISQPSN